jgi:hypothetical protein
LGEYFSNCPVYFYNILLFSRRVASPLLKDESCKFHSEMAQWFLRRLLHDPTLLYFCHYLPVEEDLALYLNNVESHSPKDDLYQV